MAGSESLVRGKTRGKMFLFLVNFSPALYYLKAWNRLRTATLPPFKKAPPLRISAPSPLKKNIKSFNNEDKLIIYPNSSAML